MVAALLGAVVTTFLSASAQSGCPYTPANGSAERKAIMDSLREPVMKELGQRVIFVVSDLKVCENWAFVAVEPKRSNEPPVDWSRRVYGDAVAHDMCGGFVHALLVKKGGRWHVREHVICATNVPWVPWPDDFAACLHSSRSSDPVPHGRYRLA